MKSARIWLVLMGLATVISGCGPGPGVKKTSASSSSGKPTIVINSGLEYTKFTAVTLALTGVDATEMYITQTAGCTSGGTWVPFVSAANWTLTQTNALNTVYFATRNASATSECVSDTITHDTVAPTLMIVQPLTGDYVKNSNKTSFPFQGTCSESGATIDIGGDITDSTTCSFGTFSKNINLSGRPDGAVSLTATITDLAANTSGTSSVTVTKDTVAPTLTQSSPIAGTSFDATQITNVTFSGTCSEETRLVVLSGAVSDSITCTTGTWSKSYNLSSVADGSFTVNVNHQDAAGNPATQISRNYFKDTLGPTITISTPAENSYVNLSNYTSYTIAGTCSENGRTVTIAGSGVSATATCTLNNWALVYNFTSQPDGPLNITASISDVAGNTTTTSARNFTKDILPPQSEFIEIEGGDATTNFTTVSLDLYADGATQMYVTNSSSCSSGGSYEAYSANKTWALPTPNSTNTVYVKYRDAALNESTCVNDSIYQDSTAPTISFTTPANGSWVNISNKSSFTISGACSEEGQNVVISGSASATVACTGLVWTATVNVSATPDGTNSVSLTVNHSNVASVAAVPITRTFSKDTVAPSSVSISSPSSDPYSSASKALTVFGTCEANDSIDTTGGQTLTGPCVSGSFSMDLSQTVDGSFDYTFTQKDAAGNQSAGNTFTWVIDSTIPAAPVLTSPIPNPIINNLNSVTIAGSCVTGNTVDLSGDVVASDVTTPSGSLQLTCAGNSFNFVVQKLVDGTYQFSVTQTNVNDVTSAATPIQWTRDTVAPAILIISNPPTDPYTAGGNLSVSGSCETGATVKVALDSTQSTTCIAGAFSMVINKAVDKTYNFNFSQTDAAGNTSPVEAQQWVRDSSVLPSPVITSPATSPFTSNTTDLTVSGTCVTGYTVKLESGALASEVLDPVSSLTQTCVAGAFSYTIHKAADASYIFNFSQTDSVTVSPNTALTWVRDTTPPNTTISVFPSNPNLKLGATFNFTSSEVGSIFECNLDSGGWNICTSPLVYSTITNTNHVLEVRSTDVAGNVDASPASYSWTQDAYKTVALYHFNSGFEFVDSSFYTTAQNNVLTNTGTTPLASGQFSEARTFTAASSQYMSAADNNSLETLNEKMTVDLWVKFTSYPSSNGQYAMLVSKTGASGQYGWEVGVRRTSGNYRIAFRGSLNGTTVTEKRTTSACFNDTTTWHHVAVTWNKGTINFYCDGIAKGSALIGTAGSSVLFNSTANLRLGRSETVSTTYQYLDGKLDEVRLSQIIRWNSAFTVPTSEFTPD